MGVVGRSKPLYEIVIIRVRVGLRSVACGEVAHVRDEVARKRG